MAVWQQETWLTLNVCFRSFRIRKYQLQVHASINLCNNEKKRSEETQTLRAGCSKAEPKKIRTAADPLPGGAGRPNLISWSLPLAANPVWWGSMHAISSYRGNRPTNTHTPTSRQDRLHTIHCAAVSLARSVIRCDHLQYECFSATSQFVFQQIYVLCDCLMAVMNDWCEYFSLYTFWLTFNLQA